LPKSLGYHEASEPPGTDEYTWYTWHTNNSGNLLAFMENFIYYFPRPDKKFHAGILKENCLVSAL